MQQQLRKTGDAKDEAQRFSASQAARETAELDPRSVLLTIQEWIRNGETERAHQFVREYRAAQKGV